MIGSGQRGQPLGGGAEALRVSETLRFVAAPRPLSSVATRTAERRPLEPSHYHRTMHVRARGVIRGPPGALPGPQGGVLKRTQISSWSDESRSFISWAFESVSRVEQCCGAALRWPCLRGVGTVAGVGQEFSLRQRRGGHVAQEGRRSRLGSPDGQPRRDPGGVLLVGERRPGPRPTAGARSPSGRPAR